MQMKRWAVAVLGCALMAGWVPAAPPPGAGAAPAAPAAGQPRVGMVYIVGGAFEGEIDEVSVPNKVVITTKDKTKTTIDRRAVEKIVYYDTPKNEFDAKLSQLKPDDANGRVALARWALGVKQPGLAREALAAAARINPNLPELKVLNDEAAKMLAPPPAATQAVAATTKPAGPDTPPVVTVAYPVRTVTPAEINLIRQLEWQAKDTTVKAQVPPDVRKRFIDSGIMAPKEAAALGPQQLAWEILQHGQPGMKEAVKILNDPPQLQEFNQKINRTLQIGCIQCHTNGKLVGKNNKLALFQGETQEASYSNYLILNQFSSTVNGVRYEMIDRTRPDGSLLLQFALPPSIAEIPHPPVPPIPSPQYAGAVKTRAEPKYKDLVAWVRSLSPIPPTFDINLSLPLPKAEGKGPARP